ncbi:MAG: coproporphyrinogen III oxidase [Cetobacterium sp.]|uniref:coproporphyrinogen III oxidase n=1 Tax=Cetobacterium sp. TaxID=2071632 RepID=UPI003F375F51
MLISSNFKISEASLKEFIRILVPEGVGKDLNIFGENCGDKIRVSVEIDGKKGSLEYKNIEKYIEDQKFIMAKSAILKAYGKEYPWGGLIGVRPTKMTRRFFMNDFSEEEVKDILRGIYLAKEDKINLVIDVLKIEEKLLNREAMNMYIGIPYCPSKCRYCSFASYEVNSKLGKFFPEFVDTLIEEIKILGAFSKEKKIKYESIYIGGGTPSTLSEDHLEKVLEALHKYVDLSNLKEFTFEAGREDSITKEKLLIMKKYGVDRVSLNPQTFNENTLEKLNRKFNRENFDKIYNYIKEIGFILNMDIILGLPGEELSDILNTLEELRKYDMENLTVHSLAVKKGSILYRDDFEASKVERETVEFRIQEIVKEKNMHPYYMYRQKNSLDWGENVGYSKPGFESRFNIEMIEENQSTMGLGGGAITKLVVPETELIDQIERLVNPKDPFHYIQEMVERNEKKKELFSKI